MPKHYGLGRGGSGVANRPGIKADLTKLTAAGREKSAKARRAKKLEKTVASNQKRIKAGKKPQSITTREVSIDLRKAKTPAQRKTMALAKEKQLTRSALKAEKDGNTKAATAFHKAASLYHRLGKKAAAPKMSMKKTGTRKAATQPAGKK